MFKNLKKIEINFINFEENLRKYQKIFNKFLINFIKILKNLEIQRTKIEKIFKKFNKLLRKILKFKHRHVGVILEKSNECQKILTLVRLNFKIFLEYTRKF